MTRTGGRGRGGSPIRRRNLGLLLLAIALGGLFAFIATAGSASKQVGSSAAPTSAAPGSAALTAVAASERPSNVVSPSLTALAPTALAPQLSSASSPPSFTPQYVSVPPPAVLATYPQTAAVQAAVGICAATRSGCAGVISGTSTTCSFPPYPGPLAGVIAAGWAMWQVAPDTCVYAMGTVTG